MYWDGEDAWYLGTVTAFSEEDHMHSVPFQTVSIPCSSSVMLKAPILTLL